MKKLSLLLVLIFPALCAMAQQNPQPAVVNSNDLRGRVEAAFELAALACKFLRVEREVLAACRLGGD